MVMSYYCLCCYEFFPVLYKIVIRKPKSTIEHLKVTEGGNLFGFKDGKEVHVQVPTRQKSACIFLFKKWQHA